MIRLVALIWIISHAVLTALAGASIIVTAPGWTGDQAGLFLCMVALYWTSLVWAVAVVTSSKSSEAVWRRRIDEYKRKSLW